MKWTELQDTIAQRYCGTVLVLDDEVEVCTKTGDGVQINPLFLSAKRAFENKGMLCDLRHIEHDFDDHERIKHLRQQWRRSDTVVLDWYLGGGKQTLKDPTNALQVLRDLSESGGFRFALIQSKENPDQIVARLRKEFPECTDMLVAPQQNPTADDDESEVVSEEDLVPDLENGIQMTDGQPSMTVSSSQEAPSTYRLTPSLYVSVVEKDKDHKRVVDVPFFFASGLKRAFPDHLHWVGFDFASRVRELLPKVLAALPSGTDVALVFQALLQGDDELGDSLVECLTDEVRELLRSNSLESASDKTIIEHFIEMSRTEGGSSAWNTATARGVKDACKYVHSIDVADQPVFAQYFGGQNMQVAKGRKKVQEQLSDFIAHSLKLAVGSEGKGLHDGFGALREHYQTETAKRLTTGIVLRRSGVDTREWLLCLSPSCDCARGDEEREYLFVEGEELGTPQSETVNTVQTCLSLDGGFVHIKWSSKRFKTIKCSPYEVTGFEFHSRLRDDFVYLLTQRVFGWQSRVGVNTSEFLRVRRERP